jgi:hypothetical protein
MPIALKKRVNVSAIPRSFLGIQNLRNRCPVGFMFFRVIRQQWPDRSHQP